MPGTVDDLIKGKEFKTLVHLSDGNIEIETIKPKAKLYDIQKEGL